MENAHKKDQTNKQGLYQRKRNNKEFLTYTQFVIGACEEF